jgi:hypothetical protein
MVWKKQWRHPMLPEISSMNGSTSIMVPLIMISGKLNLGYNAQSRIRGPKWKNVSGILT